MKSTLFIVISATVFASAVPADEIDPLIGTWISPDGQAKQRIARSFDGSWLEISMWFLTETGWKQVSAGASYQRPGEEIWRGVVRTRDMYDIELFENTVTFVSKGRYDVANVAYQSDGTKIISEEEWEFDDDGRHFSYIIYKFDAGQRMPWMKGRWARTETAD